MSFDLNNNEYLNNKFTEKEINITADLLRKGLKDAWKINLKFERKFAEYMNCKYCLACSNGTAAMEEALWACGIKAGDEVIVPVMTYWASAFPALILGAKVKYADIDKKSLCISPKSIKEKITSKTKAIVVVHLYGHPCDMDAIMSLANKFGLKVIEDFSHAHGALYKGRLCGTIGDVGIASCMGEKAFYLPEGAVLCTNSKNIYEKSCLFGHYRYIGLRENSRVSSGIINKQTWQDYIGAPLGAIKDRMNPVSAIIGIERLNHFSADLFEINKAMDLFVRNLEKSGFYKAHRIRENNSSMGGRYSPVIFSKKDTHKVAAYIKRAGFNCKTGHRYFNLNEHPMNYNDYLRNNLNKFSNNSSYSLEKYTNADQTAKQIISIPRFTKFNKEIIEKYSQIYIEAAENTNV